MTEHAFIAGGSSGIGLATAARLLGHGFKVTIAGRDPKKLDTARKTLRGDVAAVVMDGANPAQVRNVFDAVRPVDHLVLAFGSGKGGGPFASVELDLVRQGFEEKVLPHFGCAQAVLPVLNKNGSITFVSAVSAHGVMPGTAGLGAANAAIAALVPNLAAELRPLRINAVSPGVIDTPWWNFLPAEQKAAVFAGFAAKTPVGRVGTPEDIAKAVVFLVSNTFMSGHVIVCDGGLRLISESTFGDS
jgi:NAD(P)-dependent dehydrogenase (short-subunit alcohol dehydrogenase family)